MTVNPRQTIADIAALHHVTVADLTYGGKIPKLVKARRHAIEQLYADGLGVMAIAYYLEIDRTTVTYHLRRLGWTKRWIEQPA